MRKKIKSRPPLPGVKSPQWLAIFLRDYYIIRNLPHEAVVVSLDPGLETRNYS
jgi:hypothetical protein